ncbi:MAG: chromosome segregation protein SMC [Salinisphaeraceae bacterium]|nr:chromosome segregation protein SMC [Salinisphaeraceae bacterium]
MRLTAIKLAGFKSFVDPTVFRLPGSLIGVVGPNGCGKSNVIDAVRWVTGESSAKQLRGGALEDVIFNGSRTRKPVGRASVEMLFDNTDSKLEGQYAKFSEIAIRRELSRDGESRYFINNSRCRRRDIIDLFLGTGLGGRSNYAIIEQGMIARLIEAKPEEVRLLLEETAGISKYKERRRETENRIRSTRENLDRLNDLRSELTQRLAQLKRQSENAEKFQKYKKEERQVKAELLYLKWASLQDETNNRRERVEKDRADMAERRELLQSLEAAREKQRASQSEANQATQKAQAEFYAAEAEVSRIEQNLAHAKEMREVKTRELQAMEQQLADLSQRIADEEQRQKQTAEQVVKLDRTHATVEADEANLREQLTDTENDTQQALERWDHFNADAQTPMKSAEAERARVEQMERLIQSSQQRLQRLRDEQANLAATGHSRELNDAEEELKSLEGQLNASRDTLAKAEQHVNELRERNAGLESKLHEARHKLEDASGRLAGLQAMQQAALNEDNPSLQAWLQSQGLEGANRLAQQLKVKSGWETAVESALSGFLEAVCVQDISKASDWPDAALALVEADTPIAATDKAPAGAVALSEYVEAPAGVGRLLGHVFAVEDDASAIALKDKLSAGQRVISQSGLCVGSGWIRREGGEGNSEGVVAREQSIRDLRGEIESLEAQTGRLGAEIEEVGQALKQADETRREQSSSVEELRRKQAECMARRQSLAVRVEQNQKRADNLAEEIAELETQTKEQGADLAAAQQRLESSMSEVARLGEQREGLQAHLKSLRAQLAEMRESHEQAIAERQRVRIELTQQRSALEASEQALKEFSQRREDLKTRCEALRNALQEQDQPGEKVESTRESALERRSVAEAALKEAREALRKLEAEGEDLMRRTHEAERAVDQVRERLQQSQLALEGLDVRSQTLTEQMNETGHEIDALREGLDEEATLPAWEERLEKIERRIQRLGPINLAAIGEFEEEQQREAYLIEQHADLTEALDTLETAIRKIDKETRARFKETFEQVNKIFSELFPRLFGGGEAALELTGEDLLDTGVRVMARPPGKRNSSIQMLSGGEKSMTAVALLFAMFELNPAPFCMLDEVDAPLDDANVGRFCNLVKEMAENVQFIVITHNKVTMEMMHQLNGVTMQEPGVSRLVSVDVEQALDLAS